MSGNNAMHELTNLEVNILLIINGHNEGGEQPTSDLITSTVALQARKALRRLVSAGLVEEIAVEGYHSQHRLAAQVPYDMTSVIQKT